MGEKYNKYNIWGGFPRPHIYEEPTREPIPPEIITEKWSIDKEFSFEMGHRVWSQVLDKPGLSITTDCACKHLHGHSYTIKVFLSSNQLDQSGMVTDFKNLNFMKVFVDEVLDHKFMIDVNDPMFERITGKTLCLPVVDFTNLGQLIRSNYSMPWPRTKDEEDFVDSFVLVNFVPTSENICRALKHYAQAKLQGVAHVEALELWETKKSHCRFVSYD